jgi:hypothetical protein
LILKLKPIAKPTAKPTAKPKHKILIEEDVEEAENTICVRGP